jgi:trans-2,3-dihydro-3-hydroxyanthranilate isomerase
VYTDAMRKFRYVVCDVFTDRALEGNQLAVFTQASELSDGSMQLLAREMAFSETVFLTRSKLAQAKIRIFTPVHEIPFAGHPVLGTAFVVGGSISSDVITLETGKGVVAVQLEREHAKVKFGWMQQPLPTVTDVPDAEELCRALGVSGSRTPIQLYDNGAEHSYVHLESLEAVAAVAPDFGRLAKVCRFGVSTFAGSGNEWKTRMFAPAAGVNEDPATGSAAGPLALHLARHGHIAFGDEIRIEQGAEIQRPSVLYARVTGSSENVESVSVGGSAVIVARGEFSIP